MGPRYIVRSVHPAVIHQGSRPQASANIPIRQFYLYDTVRERRLYGIFHSKADAEEACKAKNSG
ncbi:hypothetical protein DFO50_10994 [Microvirgula sp. AG722]|nr:hypothetical protein DFO50_10994 [Microvirgula sp. AG722]